MQYFDIIPPQKNIRTSSVRNFGLFAVPRGWKKYAVKALVLLLMIGMNWGGISAVSTALAYYFDIEMSKGSVFAAGGLDFSISDSGWLPPEDGDDLGAGAGVSLEGPRRIRRLQEKYRVLENRGRTSGPEP